MKKYRSIEMIEAYKNGGYRERYAMDNGNKTIVNFGGHKCLKFTLNKNDSYQDANGSLYDTVEKRWRG